MKNNLYNRIRFNIKFKAYLSIVHLLVVDEDRVDRARLAQRLNNTLHAGFDNSLFDFSYCGNFTIISVSIQHRKPEGPTRLPRANLQLVEQRQQRRALDPVGRVLPKFDVVAVQTWLTMT